MHKKTFAYDTNKLGQAQSPKDAGRGTHLVVIVQKLEGGATASHALLKIA